jgi:hypothetical protein
MRNLKPLDDATQPGTKPIIAINVIAVEYVMCFGNVESIKHHANFLRLIDYWVISVAIPMESIYACIVAALSQMKAVASTIPTSR